MFWGLLPYLNKKITSRRITALNLFVKDKYTKSEAIDILSQCRLLRESIDALEIAANRVLLPKLRLVNEKTDNLDVLQVRDSTNVHR